MAVSRKAKNENDNIARLAVRTSKIRPEDKTGDTEEERTRNKSEALSPQTQLGIGRDYCLRNKLALDDEASEKYMDLDVSGSKIPWRKRPALMKHYEDAKKGLFRHLLFYKLTRAGRNLRDTLDLIHAFEQLGIVLHGVKENVVSSEPTGRVFMHLLLVLAEHQAEEISENIQDVVLTRARRGDINGRYPLMWLRSLGKGEYEVIPEMEFAMRRMVELRMGGHGYQKTAKHMNDEGLRTLNGKLWTDGKTYKHLSPTYIDSMTGTAFLNRDLPSDHDYHVRIPNVFPPILSDEEADALRVVQAVYKKNPQKSPIPGAGTWTENNAKVIRNGRVRADGKYLLASVAFCAACGAALLSMQHTNDRPNKRAYDCHQCRVMPDAPNEGGHQIVADSLEDGVLRVIRHVLQEPPAPCDRPIPRRPKKMRTPEDVEAQMKHLLDMHMEGTLEEDHFKKKYQALREELNALLNEKDEKETPDARTREAVEKLLAQAGADITHEQLRQLILMLVKRVEAIIVFPGVYVRGPKTNLRRHARVTLNIADSAGVVTWLVPLYLPRYQNVKDAPFPVYSNDNSPIRGQDQS